MPISSLSSLPGFSASSPSTLVRVGNASRSQEASQIPPVEPLSSDPPTFVKVQPEIWDSKAWRILQPVLPAGLIAGSVASFLSFNSVARFDEAKVNGLVEGLKWGGLVMLGLGALQCLFLPNMKSDQQAAKNRYEDKHDVRLLPVPGETDVFRQVPILTREGDRLAYDARGVQTS